MRYLLFFSVFLQFGWVTFGQKIQVSHQSGSYEQPFYLKVNSDYQLRYTIDGNTPDLSSSIYQDSIPIGFSFPPMKYSLIPTNYLVYNPKYYENGVWIRIYKRVTSVIFGMPRPPLDAFLRIVQCFQGYCSQKWCPDGPPLDPKSSQNLKISKTVIYISRF